jgi:MoaD family protein
MARVSVSMFATVREAAGVAECLVEASDLDELLRTLGSILGKGVADLVARAERDPDGMVVLLNGKNVPPGSRKHARLAEGDEVSIFPPVSGG